MSKSGRRTNYSTRLSPNVPAPMGKMVAMPAPSTDTPPTMEEDTRSLHILSGVKVILHRRLLRLLSTCTATRPGITTVTTSISVH